MRTHQVLDGQMKSLTSAGIGAQKRQAQPFLKEQEQALWEKEIFSCDTAESLVNMIFWYNCKCFGLRGGDEHRNLEVDQYSLGTDE